MGERSVGKRVGQGPDPLPLQLPSPLAQGCRVLRWVGGARELTGGRVPHDMGEVRSPEEQWPRAQQWLAVCAELTSVKDGISRGRSGPCPCTGQWALEKKSGSWGASAWSVGAEGFQCTA